MELRNNDNKKRINTAKECAFLAVFVAVVIAVQIALAIVPAVELVTVLFVAYSFVMGWKRGMLAATAFSLLRQMIFGFFPNVLLLYLLYYNCLTLGFGLLGKKLQTTVKLPLIVILSCVGTVLFTLTDNIITTVWYAYSAKAAKAYILASLSVMFPQVVCTAVSVSLLFLPLWKVLKRARQKL
ncbi:MAG: hypothetical protein IKA72_01165 [Clostridia bacterium]|nr:hypothetical protein [Clostridia bacterium]